MAHRTGPLAALLAAYFRLAAVITTLWAVITFAALLTAALAIPHPRRFLKRMPGA